MPKVNPAPKPSSRDFQGALEEYVPEIFYISLVQEEGIEPSRIKDPPDFESGASASSATPARR
jgi:hypothetical protein